jgi:hypothetical protein
MALSSVLPRLLTSLYAHLSPARTYFLPPVSRPTRARKATCTCVEAGHEPSVSGMVRGRGTQP